MGTQSMSLLPAATTMCPLLLIVMVVPALSDYPYYTDYSSPYNSIPNYFTNLTAAPTQRVFDPENPLTLSINVDMVVPIPDLDTELSISAPFSFDLTGETGRSSRFVGRSLDHRQGLYNTLSWQLGQITGKDGESCLLRAICEVAETPNHVDGLWGEMINLMLSASSSIGREMGEIVGPQYNKYLAAQSLGESGDCSSLHGQCPLSFFNLFEDK